MDDRSGQVLMVAPPDGWVTGPQDWLDALEPSGVILFRRNLPDDFETARAAIARLHAWAIARGETMLVAMDEEGGFVTQTSAWFPTPPSARALAWAAEPAATRHAYRTYGRRLRQLGVNVDFAPVCDVNNNPQNPVIGVRSFGTEPDLVASYAREAMLGLLEAGMLPCAKHFPGHGDTDVDSHLALPVVQHDAERLERTELVPFRGMLADVPLVMVAHVACPRLSGNEMPATLAPEVTTRMLREELRFEGVAITDAMDMQGVAAGWGIEEAAVRAFLAGCDLLLYCFEIEKPQRARAAIRAALHAGRIPAARFATAIARIERLRARATAVADAPLAAAPLPALEEEAAEYRELCRRALRVLDPPGWRALARAVHSRGGVTLVGGPAEVLERVATRLRARGLRADIRDLAGPAVESGEPVVAVLGERRPLAPERIAALRRLALQHTPVALANVLTPEIDAPLVETFATILRTADHSDAMLDLVVERLADASL